MSDPEGASATEEARKAWLEKIQRAAQQARDEIGEPPEPIVQGLTADLEQLARRLQREQENADHGESGPASGIT